MSKRKITITLEPEVIEVLAPLQASLEEQAHGAVAANDVRALYGPVRYSRSSVVQMAILALCASQAVPVNWRNPAMALDVSTGEAVPIPDSVVITENPENSETGEP